MVQVEIGRTVSFDSLETAVRDAAEEMGWKVEVRAIYEKGYKLGSVEETSNYKHTEFVLKGRFGRRIKTLRVYGRGATPNFFMSDIGDGTMSAKKTIEYLSAVSEHLST